MFLVIIQKLITNTVFTPFIDTFLQSNEDRFVNHKNIFSGFQCIINFEDEIKIKDIEKLTEFYKDDLEDANKIYQEVKMWHSFLKTVKEPCNILEYLDACDSIVFPNVHKLIQILATLPVTTCTTERSFSSLRRLKTYLRNTMGLNRLNSLALLNIHRDITITPDEIWNEIIKKKKVRLCYLVFCFMLCNNRLTILLLLLFIMYSLIYK